MSALLAPLLAQLVTVGITDRTDVRYFNPGVYRYEAATRPAARVTVAWPRYSLSFGYGAALSLVPLESKPRDLLVYHSAFVGNSYTYKRTTVTLSSGASWGEVNLRTQALGTRTPNTPADGGTPAAPTTPTTPNAPTTPNTPTTPTNPMTPPGGTPTVTPGGQLQPNVVDGPVSYGLLFNSLAISHQVTRPLRLSALGSYTIAGGLDSDSQKVYPIIRGTTVGLNALYLYAVSARDSFGTSVTLQQAWSSLGSQVTSLLATESWNHRFDKQTSGVLSAGVSMTRTPLQEYYAYSIYPAFGASINHTRPWAGGGLTLSLGGYSAPALDPLRATVDPRVGLFGNAGWTKDRFSARIGGGSAVSIAASGNNAGAFNTLSGTAGVAYRIAKWVQADAGVAVAQQAYQDRTTIPLSYAAFVGVTVGVEGPVAGSRR